MVAGLLALGARALPFLARVGPAIAEGIGSAGTLARVVGAGIKGQGGNANRALSQIMREENAVARVAGRRATASNPTGQLGLNLEGPGFTPEKLGVTQSYAQAAEQMSKNPFLGAGYKVGQGYTKMNQIAEPLMNVANVGITGVIAKQMYDSMQPQIQPDSPAVYATAPFNNAYTQLPTPSGGQFAVDPRGGEMVGGMQAAAMSNDQQGGGGRAPYGLTDEQIVKAKRRAEETAQLNQLYASTLSGYQMPN